MQTLSDTQLLRDYADRGAERAFAEIVTRHTDLVYSAALRQVYSPDLARDVTQSVFTDLARKAREVSFKLSPEASLVGWLYRGTRFAARDLYRNETRRTQRERQAMAQLHPAPETPPDWEQLRPVLDDAMAELDDTDRDAVLLRYFKNHDLRTVGATLGISDDAAQKRVSRAVEQLREFFAKRRVTVGASGLVVVISANAVQAAPVGLALTISTATALTGTTLATTATVTATKAIAMTALQKTIVTATIAVLAGVGIYEARQASQLRGENQSLLEQMEQLSLLRTENEGLSNMLAQETNSDLRLKSELLRLRSEVGLLRRQTNEFGRILEKRRALDSSVVVPIREAKGLPLPAEKDDPLSSDLWAKAVDEIQSVVNKLPTENRTELLANLIEKTQPPELFQITGLTVQENSEDSIGVVVSIGQIRERRVVKLERTNDSWQFSGKSPVLGDSETYHSSSSP